MIRSLAALLLLFTGPAAAQPGADQPGPVVDRDTLCFLVSAVHARRMEASGRASEQDRQIAFLMHGVANYYAGRTSTRHSGAQLAALLVEAVRQAERLPDIARSAMDCAEGFHAFMRIVSSLDSN